MREILEGLLEMVHVVAKSDDHFLDRRGDGGGVELENAETGRVGGRLRGVVLGGHFRRFLSGFLLPRSFVGSPVGLPFSSFLSAARLRGVATWSACGVVAVCSAVVLALRHGRRVPRRRGDQDAQRVGV